MQNLSQPFPKPVYASDTKEQENQQTTKQRKKEEKAVCNTINITHMMMDHSLKKMAHHAHFVVVLIILLNIALKGNMTSIISWRK